MTTTASRPQARTSASQNGQPADVFVVFGITGDLAKVMTFRSLYRLERRGLLNCPIVGVAVDDWTLDDLREHARKAIEAAAGRSTRTCSTASPRGSPTWRATSRDAATFERLAGAIGDAEPPVFYLEIPPFLFGTVINGLAAAGLTENARVVVEKPFGHDLASAARAQRRDPPAPRRVAAVPDRPLPRQDGPRRRSSTCGSRTRCSSRSGTATTSRRVQITMAESFGVEDRGHFYDPVGALRDVVVNHLMQVVARRGDGAAREQRRGRRSRTRCSPCSARCPTPIRPTTSAASTTATATSTASPPTRRRRPTPRCGWRSRTGAGRACRSSSAPASDLPITQTELRLVFKRPPRLGFGARPPRLPEPDQLVIKLDPTTGIRLLVEAQRGDATEPEQIHLDMEFARRGRRGPDALRGAAARGDERRQHALHPAGRRRGGVADHAAAARRAAARPRRTRRDPGGPAAADRPAGRARPLARARGWRHERHRRQRRPRDRSRRAPPLPRRSRRSPTTRSSRTATRARWSRPTARSTGCACPRFDSPSVFGTLLDRGAGIVPARARSASTCPVARAYEPGTNMLETTWHDAERLGRRPRRAHHGPAARRGHRHPAHPAAGRRRRRPPARAHRRLHRRAASRSSWSASPCSTTAASPPSGRWWATTATRPTPTGAGVHDPAAHRHGARDRGQPRPRPPRAARGRGAVLRALVGRGPGLPGGRR